MTTRIRPSESKAKKAVRKFLDSINIKSEFDMIPDGDADSAPGKFGWAFWINESDTTSYVHEDLSIEWYGTTEVPEEEP